MLANFFKIAWRNLLKNKVYSFINIAGLAAGMAVALLIGLWIWDELYFNRVHKNHGRLAQVMTASNNNTKASVNIAIPLGNELRAKYAADFKNIVLATRGRGFLLAAGDKKINTTGLAVEPAFPEMLSMQMISGQLSALQDPSSILISYSMAKILFGESDALNKILKVDNTTDMTVAGVYADLPHNSTFNEVKILFPWDKYVAMDAHATFNLTRWGNKSWQLFVELHTPDAIEEITRRIKDVPMLHRDAATESKSEIFLHPMDRWHLYNEFENGKFVGGNIRFVWLFGIVGTFILLLACINFINLTTARSEKRAKEVGIRKAIGSLRKHLIRQFLLESMLVTGLAFVVAITLAQLAIPFFNDLSDKNITLPWSSLTFWMAAVGFTLLTGLISGTYPAFYLSKFNPVKILKGTFRVGRFATLPRKTLVVVQFTVSIVLSIATIVVIRQIQFGKNRPVGYNREGLISVAINNWELVTRYSSLRDDLLKTGVVQDMAESSSPSTSVWSNLTGFEWEGKEPGTVPVLATVAVSHDFGKTIGWKLREGRDFSRNFPTDSGAFILNESAVQLTGFKDPVGKIIHWEDKDRKIIGVVKDMIMESPYTPVKPTVFFLEYNWSQIITIRLKAGAPVNEALTNIESVFKKYNPGSPFDYNFVDDEYAKKFSNEQRISNLSTYFAAFAIFISCLGLFGLASFVAEQRIKEIGVRKVLGASVFNLWKMLSRDFVILVMISCLFAIPVARYLLNQWLQQYQYRKELSWWIFVAACVGALFITLLTVSFQSIKAASSNPVKSLRTE